MLYPPDKENVLFILPIKLLYLFGKAHSAREIKGK